MSTKSASEIINRMTFQGQYADERWAKLSKRIRDVRGMCEFCKSTDHLQTHHTFYESGKFLWEHDDADLIVLCDRCHRDIHIELQSFRKNVFRLTSTANLRHLNAIIANGIARYGAQTFILALIEITKNERMVMNHAKVCSDFLKVPQ
ncbi:MAG: hypothetical protein RIQ93_2482 [Verrucomicrobiota bacterium]|jgi:hypothetical protein